MTGLEAAMAIRKLEDDARLPHVPIIALTANAMNSDRETYLSAGMQFLSKPFSQQELFDEVSKALSASANRAH